GAMLRVQGGTFPTGGGSLICPTLHVGDVDTLLTTTGLLTGTFGGVANGATQTVNCDGGGGVAPTVRINYTSQAVTATVLTAGDVVQPGLRDHRQHGHDSRRELRAALGRQVRVHEGDDDLPRVDEAPGDRPQRGCPRQDLGVDRRRHGHELLELHADPVDHEL